MRLQEVRSAWSEVIRGELFLASSPRKQKETSNSVSKCWLSYCPVLKEVGKKVTWQPRTALVKSISVQSYGNSSLQSLHFFYIYKEGTSLKRKKNGVMSRYLSQSMIIIWPCLLSDKGLLNPYPPHKMCFSQRPSFQSHEVIFQMWNCMKLIFIHFLSIP